MKIEDAPDLLYVLDQGRVLDKPFEIGRADLIVLDSDHHANTRLPVVDATGAYVTLDAEEVADFIYNHLRNAGFHDINAYAPTAPEAQVTRFLEGQWPAYDRIVYIGGVDNPLPEHKVARVGLRRFLQAMSKQLDIGIGIPKQGPDIKLVAVPNFHSSLRRVLDGGNKYAFDTPGKRTIKLD